MIGLLILTQENLGTGLIQAVEHVLGKRPPGLDVMPVDYRVAPEKLAPVIADTAARLDEGQGVLILADIYGASHTNAACRILQPNRIELVTGVNLPMLIRVLNYRDLPMDAVIRKAISGGAEGIRHAPLPARAAGGDA